MAAQAQLGQEVIAVALTFKKHIFRNAGHSWDCEPCRKDGYDEEATRQSLKMTLDLFEANKR